MPEPIYQRVTAEVKVAMRARDKPRLGALRLIMADFKRIEVDERIELDDERVLVILDKMTKQRKDSLKQFDRCRARRSREAGGVGDRGHR